MKHSTRSVVAHVEKLTRRRRPYTRKSDPGYAYCIIVSVKGTSTV